MAQRAIRAWIRIWAGSPARTLNTDLLLNLTALALAFALLSLIAAVVRLLVARLRLLYWPLTLVVLFMLWLPMSGNLLLLLMKLQVVPLLKSLLSFVAHVTNNAAMFNWVGAGLLVLLSACWLPTLRRHFRATRDPIARRLARADRRDALRLALTTAACAVIVIAGQLWWNLVSSQPPRLSEAQTVTLAGDGLVHLPIEGERRKTSPLCLGGG